MIADIRSPVRIDVFNGRRFSEFFKRKTFIFGDPAGLQHFTCFGSIRIVRQIKIIRIKKV